MRVTLALILALPLAMAAGHSSADDFDEELKRLFKRPSSGVQLMGSTIDDRDEQKPIDTTTVYGDRFAGREGRVESPETGRLREGKKERAPEKTGGGDKKKTPAEKAEYSTNGCKIIYANRISWLTSHWEVTVEYGGKTFHHNQRVSSKAKTARDACAALRAENP